VLFRDEKYADAIVRFERAAQIFPQHAIAWKGLGHSLLCLGRAHEAARAFDQAIGLRGDSATALWGGAVAHAEIGNKLIAQNYLRRTLALQPTWIEMARGIPQLAQFLQVSIRAADALHSAWGTFSTRTYRHTVDDTRSVEVGRITNQPKFGCWTFVTIGLSNKEWAETARPHLELVMATLLDSELCGQILANLAFHLAETGFYPEPGVMVRDVIGSLAAGDISQRLPHVFIGVPRAWKLRLPIDEMPPPITLAQVIPVSEAEYALWKSDVAGFEAGFVLRAVDVADLRRTG
jgi:tetratricopeptide (TPR) repeat protein